MDTSDKNFAAKFQKKQPTQFMPNFSGKPTMAEKARQRTGNSVNAKEQHMGAAGVGEMEKKRAQQTQIVAEAVSYDKHLQANGHASQDTDQMTAEVDQMIQQQTMQGYGSYFMRQPYAQMHQMDPYFMQGWWPSGIDKCQYLKQLLQDKKHLQQIMAWNPVGFHHLDKLLEEEIVKVRSVLFQNTERSAMQLPEPAGPPTILSEKVFVPVKENPEYNFVGRILGPRGLTAKQLEQDTQCKIMVRGRGSMRDKKKEDINRGKQNWEHLNEDLHVLITVEDTENRARMKLARAREEIRQLLVPQQDGDDSLKKKQLMELAIINGTYRDNSCPAKNPRLVQTQQAIGQLLNQSVISQSVAPASLTANINQNIAAAGQGMAMHGQQALQIIGQHNLGGMQAAQQAQMSQAGIQQHPQYIGRQAMQQMHAQQRPELLGFAPVVAAGIRPATIITNPGAFAPTNLATVNQHSPADSQSNASPGIQHQTSNPAVSQATNMAPAAVYYQEAPHGAFSYAPFLPTYFQAPQAVDQSYFVQGAFQQQQHAQLNVNGANAAQATATQNSNQSMDHTGDNDNKGENMVN